MERLKEANTHLKNSTKMLELGQNKPLCLQSLTSLKKKKKKTSSVKNDRTGDKRRQLKRPAGEFLTSWSAFRDCRESETLRGEMKAWLTFFSKALMFDSKVNEKWMVACDGCPGR